VKDDRYAATKQCRARLIKQDEFIKQETDLLAPTHRESAPGNRLIKAGEKVRDDTKVDQVP
jgi:hypothetical protein